MHWRWLDDDAIVGIGNAVQGNYWSFGIAQIVHHLVVYLGYIAFVFWKSREFIESGQAQEICKVHSLTAQSQS